MNIKKTIGFVIMVLLAISCAKQPNAPSTVVDFNVNLNDANNQALKTLGGYIYTHDIILAHTTNGAYVALQQKCTHDSTNLLYDANGDYFRCPNDQSIFNDAGGVDKGPATVAASRFIISHADANTLRIQN